MGIPSNISNFLDYYREKKDFVIGFELMLTFHGGNEDCLDNRWSSLIKELKIGKDNTVETYQDCKFFVAQVEDICLNQGGVALWILKSLKCKETEFSYEHMVGQDENIPYTKTEFDVACVHFAEDIQFLFSDLIQIM